MVRKRVKSESNHTGISCSLCGYLFARQIVMRMGGGVVKALLPRTASAGWRLKIDFLM